MEIPESFAVRMVQIHGEPGRLWIETLPAILERLADDWSIRIGSPVPNLSYNYVASAAGLDGRPWIVKLGSGGGEGDREAVAMSAYAGQGAARLERQNLELRAMLLERIEPGEDLRRRENLEATRIAADVLRQLWQANPVEGLAELSEWTRSLDAFAAHPGPLPADLIDRALGLRRDLLLDPPERVVVHGDLHHANILRSEERGWLAIDPKGLVGEKAFDIPFFLLNPAPVPIEATRLRIATFVEHLGLDRQRVEAWAFVQAILSACWTIEDHGDGWEGGVRFAEELKGLN